MRWAAVRLFAEHQFRDVVHSFWKLLNPYWFTKSITQKNTLEKKIPFSQSTLSNMTCTATAALGASAFISSYSTYPVSRDLLNCNVKYLVILNFVVLSLKSKKETCGGLFHPQVCKFKFFPTIRIKQKSFQHNRFYLQQTKLHPAGQESIHPKLHTCHLTST